MDFSSPRLKAIAFSAGCSFWFLILTRNYHFSESIIVAFLIGIFSITQLFSNKVAKMLDIFAIYFTKFLLGILFLGIVAPTGIIFKVLKIDLLRTKKQTQTYWLKNEEDAGVLKQY